MLGRTKINNTMKKYILILISLISSIATYSKNKDYCIYVTIPYKQTVTITEAVADKYFGESFQTMGAAIDWHDDKNGVFTGYITDKGYGNTIKLYGDKIIGFPNIKGFLTIDAVKEADLMKEFTLTDDPIITKIGLPTHTVLKDVTLSNLPKLTDINFYDCEGIENLVAKKLPIDELNVSKSKLIKTIDCSNCELETFTIPEKSAINKINCSGNSLSEEEVGKLIAALPTTGGVLCIYDEAAEKNNECTAKQVADAKAKNWKVVDATGKDYAGTGASVNKVNSIKDNCKDDAPYYDLQGRRIQKPTHSGLYIHNGKKIFIK